MTTEAPGVTELQAAARVRDVPRSCTCLWLWSQVGVRWVRVLAPPVTGCPWHGSNHGGKR